MATITALRLPLVPKSATSTSDSAPRRPLLALAFPRPIASRKMRRLVVAAAVPESIDEKIAESIKAAEEACTGGATTGECAAAWDEVEELSAAASHAKDRKKEYDPLETYCKDNPETDECRTYDN